jgi:hypothetical protein
MGTYDQWSSEHDTSMSTLVKGSGLAGKLAVVGMP